MTRTCARRPLLWGSQLSVSFGIGLSVQKSLKTEDWCAVCRIVSIIVTVFCLKPKHTVAVAGMIGSRSQAGRHPSELLGASAPSASKTTLPARHQTDAQIQSA